LGALFGKIEGRLPPRAKARNVGPPKLVIFDWDGTLVDSIDAILKGFELAYSQFGYPCPPASALRQTIGLPLAVAFERLTPGIPAAAMAQLYREYWFDPQRPPSRWATGALELMNWLDQAGIAMAVATGKSRRGVDHELAALGATRRFAATRSADDARPKPHPDMIHQILTELEHAPEHAVMVGDSPLDLAMGAAAGVPCYGVLGGVADQDALRGPAPRAVLRNLAEFHALLRSSF
jgi:phosphoglycolate phosphatase